MSESVNVYSTAVFTPVTILGLIKNCHFTVLLDTSFLLEMIYPTIYIFFNYSPSAAETSLLALSMLVQTFGHSCILELYEDNLFSFPSLITF